MTLKIKLRLVSQVFFLLQVVGVYTLRRLDEHSSFFDSMSAFELTISDQRCLSVCLFGWLVGCVCVCVWGGGGYYFLFHFF